LSLVYGCDFCFRYQGCILEMYPALFYSFALAMALSTDTHIDHVVAIFESYSIMDVSYDFISRCVVAAETSVRYLDTMYTCPLVLSSYDGASMHACTAERTALPHPTSTTMTDGRMRRTGAGFWWEPIRKRKFIGGFHVACKASPTFQSQCPRCSVIR
jgi:hypothetical protein